MASLSKSPSAVEYIDSHCHLDLLPQPEQLWQQCREQHIQQLIIPATEAKTWPRLRQLSHSLEGVYYSAGTHPWWCNSGIDCDQIARELQQPACIAIGECGLDKSKERWLQQQLVCEQQIRLAADLQQPLILHCVKAHNPLIELLQRYRPTAGGVLHGFSGSLELAQQYIRLGFCLGIGATISYPRAKKTIATVKQLPASALLLETDAPSMPLYGQQGENNSPLYLPQIAAALAGLRGQSVAELVTICNDNCRRIFQLP